MSSEPEESNFLFHSSTPPMSILAAVGKGVPANATYDGGIKGNKGPVRLRIGNGAAGQSGLVKALADQFIKDHYKQAGIGPFKVEWYTSDTTYSIKYLQDDIVDIGITYHLYAALAAASAGICQAPIYGFRDHFVLVGPKENPARLHLKGEKILAAMSKIHQYAEHPYSKKDIPVRFLSRFDKSATNMKDSQLWIKIGQVPWGTAVSTWYHQYVAFPIAALTAAIKLKEYTITDRGTFLTLKEQHPNLVKECMIYVSGGDKNPKDLMLNRADVLVTRKGKNRKMADLFGEWIKKPAAQGLIAKFQYGGEFLYTKAPPKPRGKGKRILVSDDYDPEVDIDTDDDSEILDFENAGGTGLLMRTSMPIDGNDSNDKEDGVEDEDEEDEDEDEDEDEEEEDGEDDEDDEPDLRNPYARN